MIGGRMKSRNLQVILLFLCVIIFKSSYSQTDSSRADTQKVVDLLYWDSEKEIGIGWAMNTTYKYSVISFKYYTHRSIWNNKIRLRFDFEGYRITKYIVPEYDRLLIQADYRFNLKTKRRYQHYILPKAGFSATFDFYDESAPLKWFGFAPNLGVDYEGRIGKFQLQAKNTITFFTDGIWYEFNPGISYKLYKNFYLKANGNVIFGFTYNGNSAIGFYPGLSLNLFPTRKNNKVLD